MQRHQIRHRRRRRNRSHSADHGTGAGSRERGATPISGHRPRLGGARPTPGGSLRPDYRPGELPQATGDDRPPACAVKWADTSETGATKNEVLESGSSAGVTCCGRSGRTRQDVAARNGWSDLLCGVGGGVAADALGKRVPGSRTALRDRRHPARPATLRSVIADQRQPLGEGGFSVPRTQERRHDAQRVCPPLAERG